MDRLLVIFLSIDDPLHVQPELQSQGSAPREEQYELWYVIVCTSYIYLYLISPREKQLGKFPQSMFFNVPIILVTLHKGRNVVSPFAAGLHLKTPPGCQRPGSFRVIPGPFAEIAAKHIIPSPPICNTLQKHPKNHGSLGDNNTPSRGCWRFWRDGIDFALIFVETLFSVLFTPSDRPRKPNHWS